MIKLNEQYSINNGQGNIVFTEGNKGTVNALYTIKGNKGEGKINGTLDGNVLKGTFHVDATAGLIEFTFTEDGFEAKWKQGLEPGPMRGKWKGNLSQINTQVIENNLNFEIETILNVSLYKVLDAFESFEKELENQSDEYCSAATEFLYTKFDEFLSVEDNKKYVFIGRMLQTFTENSNLFSYSYFLSDDEDFAAEFIIDHDELLDSKFLEIVVEKHNINPSEIGNDEDIFSLFLKLVGSHFCYTFDKLIEENDPELLAEFILSISASNTDEIVDDYNEIPDYIIDLIKYVYGFDIKDDEYSDGCEVYPNHYLNYHVESGYNYIQFSENIINQFV